MTPTPDLKAAALAATLDIEQERPDFEAAYRAKWPAICAVNHRKFEIDEDHEYLDYTVEVALQMWLSAKRSTAEHLQVVEDAAKNKDWVEWPTQTGYWWVRYDMQKPYLRHIIRAHQDHGDFAIEMWDCPGIGRSVIAQLNPKRQFLLVVEPLTPPLQHGG